MRLLLDEDVPVQLLEPLRRFLPGHEIDHTEQLGWKGKQDRFLLPDARRRGYDMLLTNDSRQLDSLEECRAIRDSHMHHLRYHQDTKRGVDGLALAMAAVLAAIRQVIRELEGVDGQRLIEIQAIQSGRRHRTTDPRVDPPPYWPSRAGHPNRPRRRRTTEE
jgi:predicted nuclease of predicted toxin-antitoxin system